MPTERERYIKDLETSLEKVTKLHSVATDPNWEVLRDYIGQQLATIATDMTDGKFIGKPSDYDFAAGNAAAYKTILRFVKPADSKKVQEMQEKLEEAKNE